MSDQATNALIAVALGSVVAVVLFAPTAAYQYRKDGILAPRDLAVLLSGAIYGLSLWTYTLLPMPVPDTYTCRGRQLDLLGSIGAIRLEDADGVLGLLREPAFLQVALNVLLFVPLGFLLRVILKGGVVVATLVGLGTSLLIETTQTTGVWNLYDCPYRLFDVDDLLVNTLGALGGSLLSFVFLNRRDEDTPPLPTAISLGRRIVGLASDLLFLLLLGGSVAAAYRGWGVYGPGTFDRDTQTALLLAVPFAVQAASVLRKGRTVGEMVVAVRSVRRRGGPVLLWRLVKLLTGVTPAFALVAAGETAGPTTYVGLPALALLNVLVAWRTEQHRGLSHVLAGLDLRIATEEELA